MPFRLKIVHYLSGDLQKTGFLLEKVASDCILMWVGVV